MRTWIRLVTLAAMALPACGGSSSETPWPIEPDDVNLGPSAESAVPEVAPIAPSSPASSDGGATHPVPSPVR
jgi:hypothetical protein